MKRELTMLAVLLAAGVIAVGAAGVRQLSRKETVSETAGHFALTRKTADELVALGWTKDGQSFSYTLRDGVWISTDGTGGNAEQKTLRTLSDRVLSLEANRRLENVRSLADYGLDKAVLTLTADWSDGTNTVFIMGSATPFADGCYLAMEGESGTVYTVDSADAAQLLETLDADFGSSAVFSLPYESLACAVFETEKGTCSFVTPDAGKDDGEGAQEEGEGEELKALWAQVTALSALDRPENPVEGDRVLAISAVSRDGAEMRVVFTEYSADFYQTVMENGTAVLVSAEKIDALKRNIRTMQ